MPASARFDDLTAGAESSFELARCTAELAAFSLEEVTAVLHEVQAATTAGSWAAGYVAYEAAPAFDDALRVRARALGDTFEAMPLVWFGIYDEHQPVEQLQRRQSGPAGYGLSPWSPSATAGEFSAAVGDILQAIARGSVYQVNHTFRLRAAFSGDPALLYRDLLIAQSGAHGALLDLGRFQVLSASPELFFRLSGDHIDVRPMKGSTRRGRWSAEDAVMAHELERSEKERAENLTIVDLLRGDLGRIAEYGSVEVEELFALERSETLWQLTSQLGATVRSDVDLAGIFAALFPPGSTTGAPKTGATGLIRDLESTPRGVYSGAVGFVAPRGHEMGAQFNVATRSVIVDREKGRAEYGTGAAITWESILGSEYAEAVLKAQVLQTDREGFSLLEVIRWDGDEFPRLVGHLARLADSAAYFGFQYSEHEVRSALTKHSVALQSTVRETAARLELHVNRQGHVTIRTEEVDLLPFVDSPDDPAFGSNPVHVVISINPVSRGSVGLYHKTTRREIYDAARAAAPGVDDVILINDRSEVTESTIANLAVRFGDVWLTPPLESGCLPGVYRAELLARGDIEEAPIPIGDLAAADDIAVVNSVRGWRRVAVVPQTDFTGRPGRSSGT